MSSNIQAKTPMYKQLYTALRQDIAAGKLLDGETLPPERTLAATLNTTVTTLRKALALLAKDGLLQCRQGSGNYICARPDPENSYSFFRIELIGGGGFPTAQVLSIDRISKQGNNLPNFGSSAQAHRIRRLRNLDDVPCILEEIWLDGDCVQNIDSAHLAPSLYQYYKQELNLWIRRAEDRVSLAPLPHWGAAYCTLPKTCGYIERLAWAQGALPIEFSRSWFHPEVARYVSRMT